MPKSILKVAGNSASLLEMAPEIPAAPVIRTVTIGTGHLMFHEPEKMAMVKGLLEAF